MTIAQLILDLDAGFMRHAFSILDSHLEILHKHMKQDFDQSGESALVDDSEYLHGVGFVTAQRYVTSACAALHVQKKDGLALGPRVAPDAPLAALVNAVANYWKHSDEWNFNKLHRRAKDTIQTIEAIGVEVPEYGGYVATNAFCRIGLTKFSDLTPQLTRWSNDLEVAFLPRVGRNCS